MCLLIKTTLSPNFCVTSRICLVVNLAIGLIVLSSHKRRLLALEPGIIPKITHVDAAYSGQDSPHVFGWLLILGNILSPHEFPEDFLFSLSNNFLG